jgi:hypothetical protein
MNPLYNCEYELSSIKYIFFGLVIGGVIDCFAFGGSVNLIIFYAICAFLGIYLFYQVFVYTKVTSKFKFIISG